MKHSPEKVNLVSLTDKLPPPIATYHCPGATLNIYKVKDWNSSKWPNRELKKLLLIARKKFLRYGNRSLLDEYDRKAAIYLAQAVYNSESSNEGGRDISEWLSVRIVSGWRRPLGCQELEIYSHEGERLNKVLKEIVFKDNPEFWKEIISGSRICGISPYFNDNLPDTVRLSMESKFTALSFALMINQFILEHDQRFSCLVGIIHDELVNQKLSVVHQNQRYKPLLTPAHEFLGLDEKSIRLDRNIYTYRFPSYWLNLGELITLLKDLISTNFLTERTFEHYLSAKRSAEEFLTKTSPEIAKLGSLLTVKGKIKHSPLDGKVLRGFVDSYVADGPKLKITKIEDWNSSIGQIIKISEVWRVS